ncbi:MAG TPA: hypothetical protein VFZ09_15440 [Archangium sp.]|uniref:hypothetical protein n=1 Tax=Archangium sp. TaxID=1872627 RepID=UPI002E33F710|nr:hypothetical protein [Archangium sp.]HEX5747640.1 hypothetical protein [Archangium sp.]
MSPHPTWPRALPALTCLLLLTGACLPAVRAPAPAPQEPPPEAIAPPPPSPSPPPEPPAEVRSLACVARQPTVAPELLPPPPAEKAWLRLQLYELPTPSGQGTSLQLRLTSVQNYSCLGYEIPARLSMAAGELRIDVEKVRFRPGPCLAAIGPASGLVVLPETVRGTFTLRLRHGGQEDQYRLVIEQDRLELSPLRARFSATQSPLVLLRAPEGALHLQCIFKDWENRCREQAAKGGPTCATFFADPEIARLEPLELKPGAYSLGIFRSPSGCFVRAPGGVEALVRHISEHYRDPSNCLYIAVHTWTGGGFSNL